MIDLECVMTSATPAISIIMRHKYLATVAMTTL